MSHTKSYTYEERCQYLAKGRAKLAELRAAALPEGVDEAVIADLHDLSLTYLQIAVRNKASLRRVGHLAKVHGLTRYRKGAK